MIVSMTGFARNEQQGTFGRLAWELRSVNHRYLEMHLRLPEELRVIEPVVRERLSRRLSRGKVEAILRYQPPEDSDAAFTINRALVRRLTEAVQELGLASAAPLNPLELLRWPGVVEQAAADPEPLREQALKMLDEALAELVQMRRDEGRRIADALTERNQAIGVLVSTVQSRLPVVRQAMRERLNERLAELGATVDPERLEQEVVLAVQKMDVAEELDRLQSHRAALTEALSRREPVGRRLDFLLQEFNREANTLASKSADGETTAAAVEMKVLIEQLREQVQNVE